MSTTADDRTRIDELSTYDSCTVSDACDALGVGVVLDGLRPLWEGARVCGPVITVELAPVSEAAQPGGGVHLGARAVERSRSGDVVVVANEGRTGMGGWGGLLSRAAVAAGVAGVVVDGACRDVDEGREMSFPMFGRDGQCRTARGRVYERSCGEPVVVAGHVVRTGDVLIGDSSGVVVVERSQLDAVLARSRRIAHKEALMAARLASGQAPSMVLGADYESMLDAELAHPTD